MAEIKKGETVTACTEQVDENGEIVSRVTVEWFGFKRKEANLFSQAVIQALKDMVEAMTRKLPD